MSKCSRVLLALALPALMLAGQAGCGSASADPRFNPKAVDELRAAAGQAGGGTDEGAAETEVAAGWGTIKGRFVLDGSAPPEKALDAKVAPADMAACGQHPIPDESLVVGSDGGIAHIAVYVVKYKGKPHPSSQEASKTPAVFDQKECRFLSRMLPVQVGQVVLIKNSDPVGHNTNLGPPNDDPFNQLISGGGSTSYRFKLPQPFPVKAACNVHSWMAAYMLPRKDAYAEATAPDGTFTLENVPAGQEIELQVWHEKSAGEKGALAAAPFDAKGRLKVTVEVGGTNDLGNISVPLAAFRQ
jgi:hypothetical protein